MTISHSAGTNAGVMEHVGDAFSNTGNVGTAGSDISLLGIAPWGALSGKETLVNPVCHIFVFLLI